MTKSVLSKCLATISIASVLSSGNVFAQCNSPFSISNSDNCLNTIVTGVPFLTISPDARHGGMGETGIAFDADVNSSYWNIAKVAMNKKKMGIGLTYTPWLNDLVKDIYMVYLPFYYKFGKQENQAFSASLRYFNLGELDFRDLNAQPVGTGYPREFAMDAGYSRKLNEKLAIGVSGRYIRSDLSSGPSTQPGTVYRPGNSVAVDLGAFYTTPIKKENEDGDKLNLGLTITNLGTKISYNDIRRDFIPTSLNFGAMYKYKIDEFNTLNFGLDARKLLVPTPEYNYDSTTKRWNQSYAKAEKMSVINGVFSSFGDAPDGGAEEFAEINWSMGAEYSYQEQFFARAGYFLEHPKKGNRQFATVGLGFKYNVFTMDLSYLVPSGSTINRNPLSNTVRFSLIWNLEPPKKVAKDDEDKDEKSES
jgi:hypothetical protein